MSMFRIYSGSEDGEQRNEKFDLGRSLDMLEPKDELGPCDGLCDHMKWLMLK
jgi:hypothetical protein